MKDISSIKNSDFLKKMDEKELPTLAEQIRKYILENVSKTGGHLSSNLGIVDLTIALLKVFDYDKDIILFDVGHQCYPYKILTGRAEDFSKLRKKGGLSGFQSLKESAFDHYETGHSSTSISTGLGMAIARDMDKKKYNVISVIGDGSIGNGLAYEALNQIGDLKTKQIIILNDNQMSISKNVGAIHNMLDSIRAGKTYNKAKKNTKNILNKTFIGKGIANFIHGIKSLLKKIYLRKRGIFSEFGIEYFGPIHGHDYKELIKYLKMAKDSEGPVILHVITQKGKGYEYAENDEIGKFHGISAFNLENGEIIRKTNLPSYSEIISSYVYNHAKKDKDIIAITPGMCYGSKLDVIKEKLPSQYLDVGIAEEHALLVANGLALKGKKPVVFIYSTFLQRGYDEIIHDIARGDTHVVFCIDRAGLVPSDGASHQGTYDIAMLTNIPNVIISSPKDASEAGSLIHTALNTNHPFFIRFPKTNLKYSYEIGKMLDIGSWEVLKEGTDLCIITYGDLVSKALEVVNNLDKSIMVVNARFIKPFDKELFASILNKNMPIIVYEESIINGSLGSVLCSEIQKYNTTSKIIQMGIKEEYLPAASREELLELTHLDEKSLEETILNVIKK